MFESSFAIWNIANLIISVNLALYKCISRNAVFKLAEKHILVLLYN